MTVALEGPSAAALTAGILLLSRARSFGQRLDVVIVGDPDEVTPVEGPAIVHSPVVASCGVGRELGSGALVIVPGPATEPLAVSLDPNGADDWFLVDRSGAGIHPATHAFVALCRDPRPAARELGRQLRRAVRALGCTPEPAVLDLLFAAPAPPLTRLPLALRAGRAMAGLPSSSITRFLAGHTNQAVDTLPSPCTAESLAQARADGRLQAVLDRFGLGVRDGIEEWIEELDALEATGTYIDLVCGLADVVVHLADLPAQGILPPLDPAMDAVAVGLGAALGATSGQSDASAILVEMYRFLGGRFTDQARYPVRLEGEEPPDERLARWQWFCRQTRQAADTADTLWRRVVDPVQ